MCGIVGYIGKQNCAPFLLEGLDRLAYRGYDSAGVALFDGTSLQVRKAKGRLSELRRVLEEAPVSGQSGIGHTRWATHGEPSFVNSHPHLNEGEDIAVVHNGIIENYMPLRTMLKEKGYAFTSETDTEVIVHLLTDCYQGDMRSAIYKALSMLEGSFALAILSLKEPDKLYCARKDSPLVVGHGDGVYYVASDIPAILAHTRRISFLEDYDVAVLSRDGAAFFDKYAMPVTRDATTIDWDMAAAEKGGFAHFMLKEICEQPTALRNTFAHYADADTAALRADNLPLDAGYVQRIRTIRIVSCGTAYHAGIVGKRLIEDFTKIPVETDIASEFRYRDALLDKDDLVIVISQSGETADTLAALRVAKAKGVTIMAICNVIGSSIAREADHVLYTLAGPEIAVASTKAYTAQLMLIATLALDLGQKRGVLSTDDVARRLRALAIVPDHAQTLIERIEDIQRYAYRMSHVEHVFFIGRGLDYASSMEAALKLKEISYIHSEAYAAGELKHGTIALIEQGTLVIAFATQPSLHDKMASNIQEVMVRGARVLAVLKGESEAIASISEEIWCMPETDDAFVPLLSIMPMQMFAYYMALQKGCDIDKPRNLAKSVTVE